MSISIIEISIDFNSDLELNRGEAGAKGATVLHKQGSIIHIHRFPSATQIKRKVQMFKYSKSIQNT